MTKIKFGPFVPPVGVVSHAGEIEREKKKGHWELPLMGGDGYGGTHDGYCEYAKEDGTGGWCMRHGPRFGHGTLDGDISLWWADGDRWVSVKTRTMWLYKSAQHRKLFRYEDFPLLVPNDWLYFDRKQIVDLAYEASRTKPGTPDNEIAVTRLFNLAARGGSPDECNQYVCYAIAAALMPDVRKLVRRLNFTRQDWIEFARYWVDRDPSASGRAVWREILDAPDPGSLQT